MEWLTAAVFFLWVVPFGIILMNNYMKYRKKKDEEFLAQHKETNRMLGEILNILKK
jgi:hypothetical protein